LPPAVGFAADPRQDRCGVVQMTVRSLAGKVVVITGGGRGIGAATARMLVDDGACVAIGDVDGELAARTAGQLGGQAIGLPLNVIDHAGFTAFLDKVEQQLGPIDVLINNAGIMPLANLDEESDEATARIIAVNLSAVIHGTREAVRRMKPRGSGHIVNIASMAGKLGVPGGATYCATKHGVVGLSEAVHLELRGTGVDVSCVMPTIVRTELSAGLKDTRMSAMIEAEDVARAIVEVLRKPRFDVYVPKYLGPVTNITRVFPRRLTELIGRLGGADRALSTGVHSPERAAYEARAAASAPAASAPDPERQTTASAPDPERIEA
jgi:NAD(P)-dependent dehydrogenase (short-subunit alcohol dehydrogenase family)